MRRLLGTYLVVAFGVTACGDGPADPGTGQSDPADSIQGYHYSATEAIARFGRYRLEAYDPPPAPTDASDGTFTVIATSDAGHRVGKVGGRFALWTVGAAAPVYLFPADTNVGSLVAAGINDRQEIAFTSRPDLQSANVYVWKASQLTLARSLKSASGTCPTMVRFTNGGTLGMMDYCSFHPNPVILTSPFGADQSTRSRFSGGTCGGITVTLLWIAEDNDNLIYYSGSSLPPMMGWNSGGCLDLSAKFGVLSVAWSRVGGGLAAGSRGSPFGAAVITDGTAIGLMNDLLDDASRGKWHILSITRIDNDRKMLARAVSLSTNEVVTVRLVPAG